VSDRTERVLVIVVTIIVSVTLFLIDHVGNGKRKMTQNTAIKVSDEGGAQ
jgi:hypothetical protein